MDCKQICSYIYIYIGEEPEWQAKMMGRITESAIASLVVHMNRYGENYFKSGIYGSDFPTQEDVIYVIVLKFSKNMTKMDLIKENVHEKSARMQIINRLIKNGWVGQPDSETDKIARFYILQIIEVVFSITGSQHYHVPITVSPFGYSTYRGN